MLVYLCRHDDCGLIDGKDAPLLWCYFDDDRRVRALDDRVSGLMVYRWWSGVYLPDRDFVIDMLASM